MITKEYSRHTIVCDTCGETADKTFAHFFGAVDYLKAEGWQSRKVNGEWVHTCPKCRMIFFGVGEDFSS